jgi:co-chaperonin GroES (HSP10)
VFGGYSGEEIKIHDQEMLLVREEDILAVIYDD